MQDRPDVAELLEAVAAFLREQVVPATEGQVAFHARVAANTLDIVRREVQLGPVAQASERARLHTLLGPGAPADLAEANRLLCTRIATGELDAATPGLIDHLRQTTHNKLAIDQPGYAAGTKKKD
ncbi:DUF6285 domain-containing protein [Variovorax boronicumulans]|uniref:DUF6285 domain-containing protein n=1 Tax=Variovorax boronicumulans TaxID=436515 RepID=UPI0012E534DE|nr:DUF6285 domain-containing protein [Variovorax boronicumulans]GER17658.1 hypothetical protein VCH24_26730 [Variovorax boronicumulans]